MKLIKNSVTFAALISLTACTSQSGDNDNNLSETLETSALQVTNFDDLELGAKIVGPIGPEVNASFIGIDNFAGKAVSYVACPVGFDECKPKEAPEGTIFTFVHTVTPGSTELPAEQSDESADAFVMLKPAAGFTGTLGYSMSDANNALGSAKNIDVQCDGGRLSWQVLGKKTQWKRGDSITFFWQSTIPPSRPDNAYAIELDGNQTSGAGPYPGEIEGAEKACDVPSTAG